MQVFATVFTDLKTRLCALEGDSANLRSSVVNGRKKGNFKRRKYFML